MDYLEYAPIDSLGILRRDRNVVIANPGSISQIMGAVSVNHLQPPFDNPLVRRALQQVLDQRETVAALGLPEGMSHAQCLSMFMCGGRYATDAGTEALREPSLERARTLLREAGYKGERVAFMHPADSVLINPMALVLIDRMRRAGFNLDVFTSDWSSIAQRWLSREPVERGGWSVVPVVYTGFDMSDPLANPGTGYNCTGNVPWSYCDAEMTPLLQAFEAEADPARRGGGRSRPASKPARTPRRPSPSRASSPAPPRGAPSCAAWLTSASRSCGTYNECHVDTLAG